MAATSAHRVWEAGSTSSGPRGQLPSISALTNSLPGAAGSSGLPSPASTRERDSGAWSSQPQSTREYWTLNSYSLEIANVCLGSSAYSTNTSNYPLSSNTNSYYMSPNRVSTVSNSSAFGSTSHPSGDYSVPPTSSTLGSPGFSTHSSLLPSINQAHDPNRRSQDFPPQESRRSSVGSQVNQGMNNLQINGTSSPYSGSVNHSSTSLAQNLSRERGITSAHGLRNSRSSAQLSMSPLSPTAERPGFTPRVAPVISRNPNPAVYSGEEPIPGQAYAFPDAPDIEPGNLPPKSSSRHNVNEGLLSGSFSRRDSGHTSIGSSIVTPDSRLPPGQHRLDDGE